MPVRSATPCTAPGCARLAVMRGRCEQHKRDTRPSAARRGYDREWQRIRDEYLANHPYCESRAHDGQYVRGVLVDHIVPLVDGGTSADSNLQTLCSSCHSIKTHLQNRK